MEHILSLDFGILNWIAEHVQSNTLDQVMPRISWLGNSGMVFIVLALVLLVFPKQRGTGVQILLALVFSLLLCNVLLKNVVERVRPFELVSGIELLVKAPHDFSFPSGHTSAAFAAATVFLRSRSRYKYLFLGFALLMGFSRLYLYVHFPSDVIGGILTGLASGYFATLCYQWFAKRRDHSQGGR